MPIRINLLAGEQAAEELRKRDPLKRAVFAGCALVALIIGWIVIAQFQVWAAKSEVGSQTARLAAVEGPSKLVRRSQLASLDAGSRLKALDHYNANRFFWGSFLDALQQVTVENIRLTEVRADQKDSSAEASKFFVTNITVGYTPPPPGWKFWASQAQGNDVGEKINQALASITNAAPFTTNTLPFTLKLTTSGTNTAAHQVTTLAEFSSVPWMAESTVIEIRGRDYGTPSGAALDDFARRINSSKYFKDLLDPARGLRFTERPPQPRPDPQDPSNPNALFVPFTIELVLSRRTFTSQ